MQYKFTMLPGEYWWGGSSIDGGLNPFTAASDFEAEFRVEARNQTMPMFISSLGRCIWSEEPFAVRIQNGEFIMEGEDITLETVGTDLPTAYRAAQALHFPPQGDELPEEFFSKPQYNTWMQFTYEPTQEGVLKYAHDIIDNGFAPGILIIDEGWQLEYGSWEFDPVKFPNPRAMADELHEMGFILMVWVTPSVRPDGIRFVKKFYQWFNPEHYNEMFLRNEAGKIVLSRWWNGYSASFDLTKECDAAVLDAQLTALMRDCGVDGFKLDGGRLAHWTNMEALNGPVDTSHTPAQRNIAWNDFGTRYRFHEYKDTFKGGGKRVIQRMADRNHSWDRDGLNTLIPNAIVQGLLGHPFICPDMIGGGSWIHRDLKRPIDQELFVRMAQCSALFPMMQFSWAPWEAVDDEHLGYIREAHDLHIRFADTTMALVRDAYRTGEPILRSLAYNYPGCDYEEVKDQFMLGENILVAPVIVKGETVKMVHLPEGTWVDANGQEFAGGQTLAYPAGINVLPWFTKKK
ncbi:MAG: glycoside hydrolase [Ruminococcaceae bacterium]|nr:glycoside hydrolase [Oscillospiraceae bacterium]